MPSFDDFARLVVRCCQFVFMRLRRVEYIYVYMFAAPRWGTVVVAEMNEKVIH